MERRDQEIIKKFTWDRNYNAGSQTDTTDLSTVELAGTREEADILVKGLRALRGVLITLSVTSPDQHHFTDELESVEALLSDMGEPNPTGVPQVIEEYEPSMFSNRNKSED